MANRKVLYLTNIPSPYMVAYLNELGKYCELKAVFEKNSDNSRPDLWKETLSDELTFEYTVLKGISISSKLYGDDKGYAPDDKAFSPSVVKCISSEYDIIIVGNPCTPTGITAILYMQLKKIPYCIQSEGGFPGSGKGLKEKFKYRLMSRADLYFSTCDLDDEYFYTYGATKERIRRYNFTSMYKRDIPKSIITDAEKKAIRSKLGVKSDFMVLTVGRSVPVKGFDSLIRAFKGVNEHLNSATGKKCFLYFVGAEKLSEYTGIIESEKIDNICFVENIPFEQVKDYYRAADVFILPTRGDTWGLVINEAMAYALPIITTDKCIAADALIKDGEGGIIVCVDDEEGFRNAMIKLLIDSDERIRMGEINYKIIQENTLEQMGITMSEHIEDYCRNKE